MIGTATMTPPTSRATRPVMRRGALAASVNRAIMGPRKVKVGGAGCRPYATAASPGQAECDPGKAPPQSQREEAGCGQHVVPHVRMHARCKQGAFRSEGAYVAARERTPCEVWREK